MKFMAIPQSPPHQKGNVNIIIIDAPNEDSAWRELHKYNPPWANSWEELKEDVIERGETLEFYRLDTVTKISI